MTLNNNNATHKIECSHCLGRSIKYYSMKCHILKTMPDGRLKILVFGDRNWLARKEKNRIRYVESYRVKKII